VSVGRAMAQAHKCEPVLAGGAVVAVMTRIVNNYPMMSRP